MYSTVLSNMYFNSPLYKCVLSAWPRKPDGPFHNFRASKSRDPRVLCSSDAYKKYKKNKMRRVTDFEPPIKIVKEFVGRELPMDNSKYLRRVWITALRNLSQFQSQKRSTKLMNLKKNMINYITRPTLSLLRSHKTPLYGVPELLNISRSPDLEAHKL